MTMLSGAARSGKPDRVSRDYGRYQELVASGQGCTEAVILKVETGAPVEADISSTRQANSQLR